MTSGQPPLEAQGKINEIFLARDPMWPVVNGQPPLEAHGQMKHF